MNLDCISENRWKLCRSDFDMAALCYDIITGKTGGMSESVFIAQYFDCGKESAASNPNIELLWDVVNEVKTILYEEPIPEERVTAVWECIVRRMGQLKPFGDDDGNLASVFLAVLKGIDLHICYRRGRKERFMTSGPLNRPEASESLVYLNGGVSLMDLLKERYRYRTGVDAGGMSDFLQGIVVFRKDGLQEKCGYPRIVPIEVHEGRSRLKKQLEKERIIRIAVIPGEKPRQFQFDCESTPGSTFGVRYPETQEDVLERYCLKMQTAVHRGANLIVFPEFFVSPYILEGMKQWLREQDTAKDSLIAVFAGTTWTSDHNNVMHILDYRGEVIGTYYKYASFRQVPGEADSKDTFSMCEYLTAPGKETVLLDVEGIGRILPAVCRDVIDGEYTERLVKQFGPDFLVTSAYSTSVYSFKRHYESYASRYYVISVLCNACDAVVKGAALNLCTMPDKENTEMKSYTKEILKCRGQKEECPESCCIMVELNFHVGRKAENRKRAGITYKRMA